MLLSMTPKKYLHDAVACHTDAGYVKKAGAVSVQSAGFNCGYDHQVIESPFISTGVVFPEVIITVFSSRYLITISACLQHAFSGLENKGPPALS